MSSIAIRNAGAQLTKRNKGDGSISGRVTVHGKPAPGLELALLPDENRFSEEPLAKVTTDENGRYHLANLPADHYWLKVKSRQYNNPGETNWQGTGRRVSVAEGAILTDADLDLTIGGAVSGRIADGEGNAVVGEFVNLYVADFGPTSHAFWPYGDEFKTNSNGEYQVYGIPPGHYLISIGVDIPRLTGAVREKNDWFSAQGRVGASRYFEQMFYPGTSEQARAHSIAISAGSEVKGINFTVGKPLRSFAARGHVIDAETGKPLQGKRHLQVSHRFGDGGYVGTIADDRVNEDGSFEITGLLSQRFFASALFKGDTDLYGDKVEFEIKDEDVNGLEIKAYHGLTMSGVIVIEGETPAESLAKRAQLKLTASSPIRGGEYGFMNREFAVNADGTFKMIGMPRGPVEISASHCDTCGFFTLERIEYPKNDGKGEMRLAEAGWTEGYRLITVDRNVKGMRVVLRYKGASILCHVNVVGALPPSVHLMVDVTFNYQDRKGSWGGWREFDANGDSLEEGLEPGAYELTIGDGSRRFTETRTITVTKNQQTRVSFTVDAGKIQRRD
jgi:5-hydroxyisourate hydrolase-like protein (transthyretin family)